MDSVPEHYSENLAAVGIEPGTSVSVIRDSDHKTTEAVFWKVALSNI
jgi:hypothetical protein